MNLLKRTLFFALFFAQVAAKAQTSYSFYHTTAPYSPLSGVTKISPDDFFDNTDVISSNLDFTFYCMNTQYTDFMLISQSILIFGNNLDADSVAALVLADAEIEQFDSNTAIYTKTEGTPGNRIQKIEIRKARFASSAQHDEFMNCQVWLYEADNSIEVHYGPSVVHNNDVFEEDGPVVTLFQYNQPEDSTKYLHSLEGNPASPSLKHTLTPDDAPYFLSSFPAEGTVYRFTPSFPTSTGATISKMQISVYPNPVQGGANFTVQLNESDENAKTVEIKDINGRKVFSGNMEGNKISVPNNLAKGVYFISIPNTATALQKLIIE